MFYDLNIKKPSSMAKFPQLLETLCSYGYNAIALTTELTDSDFASDGKGGKKGKQSRSNLPGIPLPVDVSMYADFKIKIYNRVNITVQDSAVFHKISQSQIVKKYDLISYLPGNATVLKTLTGIPDFDILAYNPAIDTPPLYFNRKLYKQFVQNGIFMEMPYTPAILDSTQRKNCIYTSHLYHAVGKSTNIIVTSAGWDNHHFRPPYDVISLCALYGLSEEQAKNSITRNCDTVLLKARTSRRGRSTMEMTIVQTPSTTVDEHKGEDMDLTSG